MRKSEFLRLVRRFKLQVATFEREAREFLESLPRVPDEAFEASTPEANLQGTLECLLADDLTPAAEKIEELEAQLEDAKGR